MRNSQLAAALSIYAALRILIFVAAFPPMNNTDEKSHFFTIYEYAQGHFPARELPHLDQEFANNLLPYWSPEYILDEGELKRIGITKPLYRLSPEEQTASLRQGFYKEKLDTWVSMLDHEDQGPPLYYLTAAAWYRLGKALGVGFRGAILWIRLLNPIFYGLSVWLSYKFVSSVYPERTFLCLAVPALLAVFPQDVFFGMNRDVLSTVMVAGVLVLMVRVIKNKNHGSLVAASFLVGLCFLVELSNCVLYGSLVACLYVWARESEVAVLRKVAIVAASSLAALLAPCIWILRNLLVVGDITGSRAKAHGFGWTMKPASEFFHHPLFSSHGLSYFLVELTRSFWNGEYVWHGIPMRSRGADTFYLLSTAILFCVVVVFLIRRWKMLAFPPKFALGQCLFLVVSSILFLAAVSLPFDFHGFRGLSGPHPFFASGRIISGILLPFVFIYARGLEIVLEPFRRWISPTMVLALLLLFITASQVWIRRAVFHSPYNFLSLALVRKE